MRDLSRFSFGATSAVTSSLALLIGLDQLGVSKVGIVCALLVTAFADNIADSLGMHIYAESKSKDHSNLNTLTNYVTRLGITLLMTGIVVVFPPDVAIYLSVFLGLLILAVLSFSISRFHGQDPVRATFDHLAVAALVLVASLFIGSAIRSMYA